MRLDNVNSVEVSMQQKKTIYIKIIGGGKISGTSIISGQIHAGYMGDIRMLNGLIT